MPSTHTASSRTFRRLTALALAATLPVLLPSWSTAGETERVFTVRGIVRGTFDDGTLRIQHDAIPNFMPAMTMPFNVEQTDVEHLRPGDHVEFEFRVGESSRASRFRKLSSTSTNSRPGTSSPSVQRSQRLRSGDLVPPFSLFTQASEPFTDAALRDRHTVLTFVFTRCPVPEFCPLIGQKFQALQRALAGHSDVRLLSITIDPEHDQPDVLRAYSESLGADPDRWTFATGDPAEIEKLTRLFAVRTERNAATLDHTLATALIAPDGKVVEIWRGNAWKPGEILARLP